MDDLRNSLIVIHPIAVLTTYQTVGNLKSRTYQLSENSMVTRLIAGCELWDIFPPSQPARTVALTCSGVDMVRLWPLPVQQPWFEDDTSCSQHNLVTSLPWCPSGALWGHRYQEERIFNCSTPVFT